MTHIKVKWRHSLLSEPVLIYMEIDSNRWEKRKIEIYPDGQMDYADGSVSSGNTRLAIEPIPTLKEIGTDPEFDPANIPTREFERVWAMAKAGEKWRFSTSN